MRVNVKAEFISPLLQFSERKINFCVLKVCSTLYSPKMRMGAALKNSLTICRTNRAAERTRGDRGKILFGAPMTSLFSNS